MGREETLARLPPLLAAHRFLINRLPAPYAVADIYIQAARSALEHRREPWRDAAHDLPHPYRRTSDTLFVLGGGESINQLPTSAWNTVGAADSLGLNFWLMHQFVPTAYVQEWIGPSPDPVLTERLAVRHEILRRRRAQIDDTPFFFRTLALRRRRGQRMLPTDVDDQLGLPRPQVTVTFDLNLLPLGVEGFTRTMALAKRCGFLEPRRSWRYLPTARGTVLWSILFAARLGYREVVLCGIDLHGTRYFYEDPDAPMVDSDLPLPPNIQDGAVHRTNDPAEPGPTMREIIAALGGVLRDIDLSLSVAHPSSLLAQDLPVFDWTGVGAGDT
jgi:hypothetical protein